MIPAADLDRCSSSLSFFDAEGMRFHLPAYLVAELENRLRTSDPLFHMVYLPKGRFEALSSAQLEAVRQFLLLRLSDYHREFYHDSIKEALANYWTADSE